jgi:ABC-type multidrug transport system ATPase subunit
MTAAPPHLIARQGIAYVPEGRGIFPNLSVRENLIMAARVGLNGRRDWTYERVLETFPRLGERLSLGGQQLSGGEQQMLTIGRALLTNPDVLILDEATEGLAPLIAREIWRIVRAVRETAIAAIIVDKNYAAVSAITDRNVILVKGRSYSRAPPSNCWRSRRFCISISASDKSRKIFAAHCRYMLETDARKGGQTMFKLLVSIVIVLLSFLCKNIYAQTIKMTVAQAGVNPGTSLYFIAQKENLFAKHGLEVKIVDTTTPAAVQAMLGGSMSLTLGAGPAFVTATLEGAPAFVVVSSWVNVFPYAVVARREIAKIQDLKGKTGQVGATFGSAPDVALRFGLSKMGLDPEKDVKLTQMPRPDWVNVIAQLEKGDVQFSVLPPPYDRMGERKDSYAVFSARARNSWQQNGEWVLKSYVAATEKRCCAS